MTLVDALLLLSIAVFFVVSTVGGWAFGFTYAAYALRAVVLLAVGLWVMGRLARQFSTKFETIARVAEAIALIAVVSLLASITSAVLAASSSPLIDGQIQAIDGIIFPFVTWPRMIAFLKNYHELMRAMSHVYVSLNWQPLLLLALVFLSDRTDVLRKFTAAWAIALVMCILPIYWLPADGPYYHYHIYNGPKFGMLVSLPFEFPKVLHSIRDARHLVITEETITGLVSMPSFHACGATILAWAFSSWRFLRWPMITLNIAMALAAIPMGGHYYSDIAAGCLVAVLAIFAVERLSRASDKQSTRELPASGEPSWARLEAA